jgi:hypothetical protein
MLDTDDKTTNPMETSTDCGEEGRHHNIPRMIAVTTFVCSSAQLTSSFRRIRGTHCFTDTSQTNRKRKEEEQVPQSNLVSVNGGFVKK